MRRRLALFALVFAASLPSLRAQAPVINAATRTEAIKVPLGLPPLPADAAPATPAQVALGKRLFYDTALSVDYTVACGTCHDPRFGFADGKRISQGVGGSRGTRNAPTIANVAYFHENFWDGRAPGLEKQAEAPVENPVEMAHSLAGVEKRLSGEASYLPRFADAFGSGPITYDKVARALAAFERTLLVGNSPFDRWYFGHEENAISTAAKRGFESFRDPNRGNCTACHEIGETSALFTDGKFHNTGVGWVDRTPRDPGRYEVTHEQADLGAFKTPSLRNVARTGPYMHDGTLLTLDDVLWFYTNGGNPNPNIDPKLRSRLGAQDREDIIEFLMTLTGDVPWEALPLDVHFEHKQP